MSDEPVTVAEARHELFELAASARALVDWYEMTGVTGVPSMPAPPAAARAPMPAFSQPAQQFVEPQRPAPSTVSPDALVRPPTNSFEQQPHAARPPIPSFELARPAPAPRAHVGRPEVLTPTERMGRLSVLADEVRQCRRCVLAEARTQTVFSRGDPFAELCFVGEGPGADEDRLGEPFVGAAGQLLDKMIAAMGYQRDEVYICNIVKCRPPNNRKPEPAEMEACKAHLSVQLDLCRPKYIVALGATAVQGLLGTTEGIMRLRGKWKLYRGAIPVMPTYHPAYLLRQPTAKKEVWMDLQEVMARLGKKPAAKR